MSNYKKFGPRAYTEADAEDFKGRDKAIKEVINLIQTGELTTIYAMSGDGKSSLIHAGLYPEMRAREWFPIEIRFGQKEYSQPDFFKYNEVIGCTPFEKWMVEEISKEANKLQLTSYIPNDIILTEAQGTSELKASEIVMHTLWWTLRAKEFSRDGEDCLPHQFCPVLVFDQFEEVINYPDNRLWTESFFRFLQEITNEIPPVRILDMLKEQYGETVGGYVNRLLLSARQIRFKILFALRKEFIGALDYWTQQEFYIPALSRNRYCLLPLKPKEAETVVQYRISTSGKEISKEKWIQLVDAAKESEGENKGLVSPLILSVLIDELDRLSINEIEGLRAEVILRKFYERQIALVGFKNRQIIILENALVDNSGRRRPYLPIEDEKLSGLDFSYRNKTKLTKMDKELHIIRCTSIHGKTHIELVHDRLADVIVTRRNDIKKRHKKLTNSVSAILTFFFISFLSILLALSRTEINNWADQYASLASIKHEGVWTTEDIIKTNYSGKIDEVLWDKGDTIKLVNMGYLSKLIVDVEHPVFVGFSDCPRLREIKFSDKVTRIDGMGYVGGLGDHMNISIGKNVKNISHQFLDNLGNDTKFVLSPKNQYLKLGYAYDSGGHSFGKDVLKTILWERESMSILFLQGFQGDVFNPDHIIFPDEFAGKDIYVGFQKFRNEEKKSLADQLTFAGRDFETFTVNPSDTIIGSYAFMKCKQLKNINLNKISIICSEAFGECSELESIDLRKVKRLNGLGFHNCYNLSEVLFPKDSITLGASEFDGCRSLQNIEFPQKLTIDCRCTFRRCVNVTSVSLPDTLIASDFYSKENELPTMFSYCPNLSKFEFSSHSLFNWREDSVLYYKDTPAFINLCTNPNWCAKDSSYYFKNGLLFKKDGTMVDACAGKWEKNGCYDQAGLFLHYYFKENIGEPIPYLFFPANCDTIVNIPQVSRGTFAIVNPSINIKEMHLPYAEPKNVGIDLIETFAEPSEISLVVPWNCRNAYENDPIFQQYRQISEESFFATAWKILKNDISDFISHVKIIKFSSPLFFLNNPFVNWISCSMLTFIFVFLMRKISKVQKNDPLTDKKLFVICIAVMVFWVPTYFLLFHTFSLHMTCISYDECMSKICLSEMVLTIIAVVVYLQFIESGILQGAWLWGKKHIISLYRRF